MTGLIPRIGSDIYHEIVKSVCETGIVKSIGEGTAVVRLTAEASCRKCGLAALGLCKSGGAGYELEATCTIPVRMGQKVKVVRGGSGYADGGFMGYGLPATCLLAGALVGNAV